MDVPVFLYKNKSFFKESALKKLIFTAVFAASVVLSVLDNKASANVIVGPTPTAIGSIGGASNPPQPSTWGLQFTANDDSHLVAFTFTQKGSQFGSNNVGTITLKDVTSNTTVDTWSVPLVPGFAPVANTLSFPLMICSIRVTRINCFTRRPPAITAMKCSSVSVPVISPLITTPISQ